MARRSGRATMAAAGVTAVLAVAAGGLAAAAVPPLTAAAAARPAPVRAAATAVTAVAGSAVHEDAADRVDAVTRPLLPANVGAMYKLKYARTDDACPTTFSLRGGGEVIPGVEPTRARRYIGSRIVENGRACTDGALDVVESAAIADGAVAAAVGEPDARRRLNATSWSRLNLGWSTSVGFHVGSWECPGRASWDEGIVALFGRGRYTMSLSGGGVLSLPASSRNLLFVNATSMLCMLTAPPGVGAPTDTDPEPSATNGEYEGVAAAPSDAGGDGASGGSSGSRGEDGGGGGGGLSTGALAGVAVVAVAVAAVAIAGAILGTRAWRRRRQGSDGAPAAAAAAAQSLSGRPPVPSSPVLILDSLDGGCYGGGDPRVDPRSGSKGGRVGGQKRDSLGEPPPLPEELWDTVGSSTSGGKV